MVFNVENNFEMKVIIKFEIAFLFFRIFKNISDEKRRVWITVIIGN